MSTFVSVRCDCCNAKIGVGETVKEARREARSFGAQHIDGFDTCQVCARDNA